MLGHKIWMDLNIAMIISFWDLQIKSMRMMSNFTEVKLKSLLPP